MSITQTHVFTPAHGEFGFISFVDWCNTLPPSEQAEALAGLANQNAITAKHLASGKLISAAGGTNTWANDAGEDQFEVDPAFKSYFDRYNLESGTVHTMTIS